MITTQTVQLPAALARAPVLQWLRARLGALLMPERTGAHAHWQAFALDPQDLVHEPSHVDRAEEYRRQAVDRVLASCPYLRG